MSSVFGDEYVPNEEASTAHRKWEQANPNGDAPKWRAFRDKVLAYRKGDTLALPNMATPHGKALVAAGKLHMSVTDIGAAPPPPPPPPGGTNELPWAPPIAGQGGVTVVNWTMTNANRMSGSLLSGAGRDLVITSGEPLTGPVQQINGWRHVIWIGGQITHAPGSGNNYALPISSTGTIHLEGLNIRCDGDGLMSRGGSNTCTWQIQNCRVEVHIVAAEHSDCFQSQGGSKINELRVARCTFLTDYQGFFMRLATPDATMNGGDWRQVNFRRRAGMGDPQQAWIFIPDEDTVDPSTGHGPGQYQPGEIDMTDVWVESTHSSNANILYPGWTFQTSLASPNLGPYSNKEGIFRLTDSIGQYVRPSTTADVVPPGGPASGQQCESAGWTGIIRMGVPPGGDYCPSTVPGHSYVSPGYQ